MKENMLIESFRKDQPTKKLFNVSEVTMFFGVRSRRTILRWISEGRFPNSILTSPRGGSYKIHREDIERNLHRMFNK
ncbi:MAG: hypothetical protein NPIRA02_29680 [Nitrospirales bacterium]|nr:MAG: hypothetical protein NPIRA02_29680 [Nitrospirales bacterium]